MECSCFEWLGITVDCIDKHSSHSATRKNAYLADITYGTNNEFGFDYLRDNMVYELDEKVQRKTPFYAIIDEVDSVLIDDARTPLIISGPVGQDSSHEKFKYYKSYTERLIEAQKRIVNNCLQDAKRKIAANDSNPETGGLDLFRAFRGFPKYSPLIKFLSEANVKLFCKKQKIFI